MRTKSLITTLTSVATIGGLFVVPGVIRVASADTTIDVTTTAAGVNPADGKCSLAEAIYAANLDANSAVVSSPPDVSVTTECTAGSGADTIDLPAGGVFLLSSPVDDLANPFGPTATPLVSSPIVIEGNGARLERSGTTMMRAFAVNGDGDLTLRNLHVKNFEAKGGAGSDGGGGGLGAGGAVYVRDGSLTIENSTFQTNRAEGGNGGAASGLNGGGGGGGLGGSGGIASGQADDEFGSIGGGGGGGARGDGGSSESTGPPGSVRGGYGGGGGGGTITHGGNYDGRAHESNAGGLACGGDGAAQSGDNGSTAPCDGGGGGGGGRPSDGIIGFDGGNAGDGGYGGGGGGGGMKNLDNCFFGCIGGGQGGHGGFGGGGGAGGTNANGGDGGFGGGGGGSTSTLILGGTFGGHGGKDVVADGQVETGPGGGGGGLGGAVFSDNGSVTIRNSTFYDNSAAHGFAGGDSASDGADAGGAIFAVDGDVTISNSTISGNADTGVTAGVGIYRSTRSGAQAQLAMTNTIVAGNSPASQECGRLVNDDGNLPTGTGSGNLITNNLNCAGQWQSTDPLLKPLAIEAPGMTPTMAIDDSSPAYDTGDDDVCEPADQRGVSRPRSLHCDIGAYEYIKPSANLGVSTTAINNAVAGTDLDFFVDVTNYGPTAAENVTLTDTLPSGASYIAMPSGHGFTCAPAATTVSCTDPLLLEGGEALLKLTVHIPATAASGSSITNSATVSSGKTPDPVPGNNTSSWTSTVTTSADVSVAKTGPTAPTAGNAVSYTIVVANAGPSTARTVSMGDTLPSGTTFTSLTPVGGWTCTTPAVNSSGSISCSVAALAPATTASFNVVLKLAASASDASQLCNTATVTTATADPVSANNSSTTCGSVHTQADLAVTQTASTVGKAGKGTATFTVTVTNAGPSDSQNVVLTVTSSLFTGPAPSIVTTGNANCSVAGQSVTCSWTNIPTGANRQATISVPWRSSVGSICGTTSVSAGTSDPNAINNKGSVCVGKK